MIQFSSPDVDIDLYPASAGEISNETYMGTRYTEGNFYVILA